MSISTGSRGKIFQFPRNLRDDLNELYRLKRSIFLRKNLLGRVRRRKRESVFSRKRV